jgi:hypothetical protein
MKINICINSYKTEELLQHHEMLCVNSLRKLKELYPDNIELVNITFADETNIKLKDFTNIHTLTKDSKSIAPAYKKRLPFLNEIFDILSTLQCDYFLFLNNDIAVSDRFIKEILSNSDYDSFVASKLHFRKLDSINDSNSDPGAISVHGFDAFAIKPIWWNNNSSKFSQFVLGKPYWDTYFFTMCYIHGNCKVLNKPPCAIFHVQHESDAMQEDELTHFNTLSFQQPNYVGQKWFNYVYNVLLKRQKHNNIDWYLPFANEEELERHYLKL